MKIQFCKEQVIKVIKSYYKIHEGKDVNIKIDATEGCEGVCELLCVNVKIIVSSKIKIMDEELILEEEINKDKVTEIFKTILREENYEVQYLHYETDFTPYNNPYNYNSKMACFDGINVEVKNNVKQKTLQ